MPDLATLPGPAVTAITVVLIVLVAIAAHLVLRKAIRVGVRALLEQRAADAKDEAMPPAELERRVSTMARLAERVGGGVIVVIAGLMILAEFNVDVGPALAGFGILGIAVGFGSQTLIRDWLAGIFIVLENQYSEGDEVRIAGVEGVVESFSLRRTTLRDLDGTLHTVPNGHITVASNMTRLWARVNVNIGVAYETDIDRATEIINAVGAELNEDPEWSDRLLEPPKVVRVDSVAGATVTLKVLGRVRSAEQWAVAGELRKRIVAAFAREGIKIP